MSVNPTTLFVLDTNARPPCPVRVHEIPLENGGVKPYTFRQFKWVEMPHAHAVKFLRDEAFVVADKPDNEGTRLKPIVDRPSDEPSPSLAPNEVIARYDELTVGALLIRAQMKPGGEGFTRITKKKDLEKFLTGEVEVGDDAAPAPADGEVDVTGEEMSEDEVAGMFDGDEEEEG